jgi:tetratricopeptide (TPR) repeat protein
MTRLICFFILSLVLCFASLSPAQEPKPAGPPFTAATNAYLSKDYKKAQALFTDLLKQEPTNAVIIANLALTEYQLGQKLRALGLFRKALHFEPDLDMALEGLKFVSEQVPAANNKGDLSLFEFLRQNLLTYVPMFAYFGMSALCLFAFGWVLISYIERRKRALETETPLPPWPWVGAVQASLFVLFLALFLLKIYDQNLPRGTIIVDQVSLQTAPGDNQVTFFDLLGGQEVYVISESGDWAQIQAPDKPAGWIKKSSLMMTR